MMLEGLVAWVLNNYLGKYVENLNTDQLSVALLSGKVELENLPLRKDALRHLGLPVEIKAGFIGKVQLQVPVRQIRSAPWLIAIEKLYLVAAPVNLDEWDSASEAVIAHERKTAILDALEAQWRAEFEAADAAGYYATSYSSWLSYGTGLLANIVENLQLKLNDIHIRYEDSITGSSPFACGLTAESLCAESCDSEWVRGFTLTEPEGCSFKLLELQRLAVYWDPMRVPKGMFANHNISELTECMSETWRGAHRYLVRPASAWARVRRERTEQPLRSRARPRLTAHLTLDAVTLNLSSRQYNEAVVCVAGLERLARVREYRARRPAAPVRHNPRDWWLYALSCHIPVHPWTEPKPTWESCGASARQTLAYVEACLVTLSNPAATLTADRKAAKDEYEWKTPLHQLKALREVAMRKVPKLTPVSTPDKPASSGRSMLVHWFPQWWGWYGTPSQESTASTPSSVLTPAPTPSPMYSTSSTPGDLEEEILDVIADSIDNNTMLKRDTVFGKFEFILNKGSLNLCTENEDDNKSGETDGEAVGPGVELQFCSVRVGIESRPRAASHALHVSLGSVCLRERITPDTLFPILIAPQGVIREGLSSLSAAGAGAGASWGRSHAPTSHHAHEPLFQLSYEKKPFGLNCDYKLWVKSAPLEVVWSATAVSWAQRWARTPGPSYAHVRAATATTLRTRLEHMVYTHAHPGERRTWHVELDIWAPQILLVEELCSRDSAVLLVDFGRLRLANAHVAEPVSHVTHATHDAHDDDERFMTPCSTPPGSLLSPGSPPDPQPALDPARLHNRLYDRYKIELSDLQILVGRARDNWKYAHTKGTSSLHLLDRFSILLQAERRVVSTSDPQYPGATLCGSLPALVAHLSEHKLRAVRAVLRALPAPCPPPPDSDTAIEKQEMVEDEEDSISSVDVSSMAMLHHNSTLFMMQFAIEQMSLEVQSMGRSIAEVQVCGVKAAVSARLRDVSVSLSVHSLLLVDALQTYGPDFELLVASHKHVGMDTMSGSIRGSEPTSPTSPTSPPCPTSSFATTLHPHALHQALNSLHPDHTHPPEEDQTSGAPSWMSGPGYNWSSSSMFPAGWGSSWPAGWGATTWGAAPSGWGAPGLVDSEALIAVELCIVKGNSTTEDLRIANIMFNNLDIIANQETIVELIGFTQRVMGPKAAKKRPSDAGPEENVATAAYPACTAAEDEPKRDVRTEITFDFHRLGVLLLRAALQDGAVVARKIATATLSEARIQATLAGSRVEVGGSLGGVQVVSLCEGGGLHTRVVAAGCAPPPTTTPALAPDHDDEKALLFTIQRNVNASLGGDAPVVEASVSVHVASVWYTHSAPLVRELRSCLSEFKQYLANLARSIRAAAADMALGLVHPRGEFTTLYSNPKLSQSTEGVSPRRRTVSAGASLDDPADLKSDNIVLSVSVELESPVVVVGRNAHSSEVVVAHLGRMSLTNRPGPPAHTRYHVRVRDISITTLDVGEKLRAAHPSDTMADLYDVSEGQPVLHNTALHLTINYCDVEPASDQPYQCEVEGKIVGGLHVSARREQYEQLLETLRWSTSDVPTDAADDVDAHAPTPHVQMGVLEGSVPTLRLDPAVRAAVLAVPPPAAPAPHPAPPQRPPAPLSVKFELPTFSVELRADLGEGERSLVELSFREFKLQYQKSHPYETMLQVSLHSITMEDLTKEPDSKHRMLMVSHTPQVPPKAVFVSKSCPDLVAQYIDELHSLHNLKSCSCSLPTRLNVAARRSAERRHNHDGKCGATPPCSPERAAQERSGDDGRAGEESDTGPGSDDNLVWLSVHTRDPQHPHFHDRFEKITKLTKVDFNCLNLVVNIDSWVAVLDFFGIAGDDLPENENGTEPAQTGAGNAHSAGGVSQTEVRARSLSVLVVTSRGEACRALVSRTHTVARADALAHTRTVTGTLGALALTDLTRHAPLWRDRLRTHADHALSFQYRRLSSAEAVAAGHETSLSIEMGPVTYVHTKRFVQELQAFARDFSLLRRVILQARLNVSVGVGSGAAGTARTSRMRLRVRASAPLIVLPVSGRARAALAAHLDHLHLDNSFRRAGDPDTVSTLADPEIRARELLDVRRVQLSGVSLWCARGGHGLRVRRTGPPLLHAPAELVLHLEYNMDETHNVADMTVQGSLSTLQCTLDPVQYRLVRGVLAHNLADSADDLLPAATPPQHHQQVWTTSSLKLDLHDVTVKLEPEHGAASLACINFIKSRLHIETYSDLGQDIDLVSQEILVSDTRFAQEPANRRGNVFSHIVQPMPERRHAVQAEVHARKRLESSAYTILVNNMRLMAILDWWEAANQFIMQPPPPPADPDYAHLEETLNTGRSSAGASSGYTVTGTGTGAPSVELKLNITDSQVVLVEDPSLWDTNAVILRSTTVITYRNADSQKPVSCELNELEVFSCVLGLEEETALSIVDPAAVHVAVNADRVLHVAMSTLNLRLSYHDMRMFAAMLQSLPVQARAALSGKSVVAESEAEADAPANSVHMRTQSSPAGWACRPRWLRAPAAPPPAQPPPPNAVIWPLKALQMSADCITLCVIDDCLDSDVPLLEVALTELQLEQDLRSVEESFSDPVLVVTPGAGGSSETGGGAGGARLSCTLSVDYYNRTLSGWEPVLEPWRLSTAWEYTLSSALARARLQLHVRSTDVLNTTVTSSLIELFQLVSANWTADYYAPHGGGAQDHSPKGSPAGHRRRSPFVPYALRNNTGHKLWFTTLLTTSDVLKEQQSWSSPDDSWVMVRAEETEPFSFGARRARRGGRGPRAEPAVLHQVALRVDGWDPPDPVCVDRVGVYFRNLTHAKSGAEARLVFEVSLEGSARKLVTVRSALQLVNKLPHPVIVRVDHSPNTGWSLVPLAKRGGVHEHVRAACAALARPRPLHFLASASANAPGPLHPISANCAEWRSTSGGVRCAQVSPGGRWAAPLSAHPSVLWTRPVVRGHAVLVRGAHVSPPAPAPIDWRDALSSSLLKHYHCAAPPDQSYRFCCVIVRERFPPDRGTPVAGHTLTLVPALRLENLLPLELQFRASPATPGSGIVNAAGTIPPGDTRPFHEVNVEEGVEISVKLEGFGWSTALVVCGSGGGTAVGGGGSGSFSARLKLRDSRSRRLYLNARVTIKKTDGIKVSVSAAYWLVNRTGLPLVFRAEGSAGEAAGQFAEHELARMVQPLLFSFAEADGGPTVSARLGSGLPGNPEWCSPFGLGVGVCVKKLCVSGGGGAGAGEAGEARVLAVGVRVRAGRGRYRHTNIATFTPRYQLHNNTAHHLQFAQKCCATTLNDPGALATHVSAVSGCYLPWHWARWEREQLLCVRILAPHVATSGNNGTPQPLTAWSGGFRIDSARTLHLACRESGGGYILVRAEVVSQGATLFVVLTDAESAPPPLRIDNYSPVSIMFHQVGCGEECVVGAHGRARWALPEPEGAVALALRAPGGPRTHLPLDVLPATHHLSYQNFIYVAFTHTHRRDNTAQNGKSSSATSPDDNVLVLEVPLGSTRVVLGRKRYGDRSQLWRRGPNEQLIHEGSSPPQPTDALLSDEAPLSPHAMVLDIEDAAPRPGRASALVLRRADPRRASTQAWRVVPPGRMQCAHHNLCVQPDGQSLMALAPGTRVVLGLPAAGRGRPRSSGAVVPAEQAVSWHTLRPGSGRLEVTLTADGPTRLVKIHDLKAPESGWIEGGEEEGVCGAGGEGDATVGREWGVAVSLGGVSVSLVGRSPPAELVHALLDGVQLELALAPHTLALALAVHRMQWDNQLLGTPSPVLLYCLPERGGAPGSLPALHASLELQQAPTKRYNAYFFRHLVVALRPLAIRLEERLILQLWAWARCEETELREQPDEADYETRRMLAELTALHATRYYFALIKIIPSQIRLSMCTANKLEGSLSTLKRRLGLTFIKFEDAAVELEPFVRAHVFDTASYLGRQMLQHFKDELKWQAAKILGSVDFLGNPLGFVADVSEGVTGLLLEGNVGALLKNVTHGISNSAAKVTESLGDGLERVVSDEAHEETRRRIRSAAPGAHLAAGFRGLGLGLLGGMTSLVKHSYEGATQEGLGGFLAGVGKGLVGTVTKPVIGVLDLAAETASALRDTSRRSDKWVPGRVRGPRCVAGCGGLLPRYCSAQAAGAALLYALNRADYGEHFLAYRTIRDAPHDIRALLSDTHLRIVTCKHATPCVVMETHLSNLVSCTVVCSEGAYFVELGVLGGGASASGGAVGGSGSEGAIRRPRVQCDSSELAAWVARHAAYARQLHHEHVHTLHPHADLGS